MAIRLKSLGLIFAATVLTSVTSFAGSLQTGSFKGYSSTITNFIDSDVMALLIKEDASVKDRYYAVLAEYDRVPLTSFTRITALTKWVPRMYAYRIDKISDLEYSMSPLHVTRSGDIEVDGSVNADTLTLKKAGKMDGAVIVRHDKSTKAVAETVKLMGKVGSTWEDYVVGKFFGTNAKSGSDYFSKAVNMELSKDGVANFAQEEVKGQFDVSEKVPGMYTFTAKQADNKGNERIVTRIAVFIDIVNWKPLATTEELLLINPDNAADVGFYYERH